MLLKEYNKGDIIFKEDSYGDCMYRLSSGSVGVYTGYGTDHQVKLTELTGQKIFGEMGILEAFLRSATIVAEEDGTKAMEISRDEVSDYLKNDPEVCKEMMVNLSHRIREVSDEYLELCNTIQEIKETWGEASKRGPGLLNRISRSLGLAKIFPSLIPSNKVSLEEIWNTYADYFENSNIRNEDCVKGQIIFHEGEEGSCMYYVKTGIVGIYSKYGTNQEELLTKLTMGQFFGEMGLVEHLPRSATAVVMANDTSIRLFTMDELEEQIKDEPGMTKMILKHLSGRLRSLTKDYINACVTVKEMTEAEEERKELAAEYMKSMDYYIAQAQSNMYNYIP